MSDIQADVVSDESNESFFETDYRKKSAYSGKLNSTKSYTKESLLAPKKMEDLFGIKEKDTNDSTLYKKPPITVTTNASEIRGNKTTSDVLSMFKAKLNIESNMNDNDIISDLGFNPKNPKSSVKSNILDDLLGTIETKRPMSANRMEIDPPKATIISRQSTETTETSIAAAAPRPKTSVGRRLSNTSNNDPLGLFSTDRNKRAPFEESIKPIKRGGSTVDWLGLGADSNKIEIEPSVASTPAITATVPHNESQPESQILTESNLQPQIVVSSNPGLYKPFPVTSTLINTPQQNAVMMATAEIEAQNAIQSLKQQEAQVVMASHIRNHELSLIDMQRRQQELLTHQETQFNELFQKQMARHTQLEMGIRSQQERINAHIQLLLKQTESSQVFENTFHDVGRKSDTQTGVPMEEEKHKIDQSNFFQMETDVKTLQLEKLRLEDLVSSLKGNHERELDIIENSYKKQIKMLEENMASVESRLREEIKSLQVFYSLKIEDLEKEKIMLRSKYDEDLKGVRDDYQKMIENIRESKLYEFSAIQDNSSYLNTLRQAAINLDNASETMQSVKYEIETKIDIIHKEREMNLAARERKVEDSEKRIKMDEESAEQDKKHLLELVSTLEIQLTKLSHDTSEQNWICKQKMSSLDAERLIFEKEKELARNSIQRDEKRVEDLKEFQLVESQRLLQEVHDERKTLSAEKAKFEALKRIQSEGLERASQVEMEMAIKVAQDAIKQADTEREKYFKMQGELETQKRVQMDNEYALRTKKDELETEIRSIRTSERRAQECLKEAKHSEQIANRKLDRLHLDLEAVITEKSNIAINHLKLIKEYKKLKSIKLRLEENKCSLCKITDKREAIPSNSLILQNNKQTLHTSSNNVSTIDQLLDEDITQSLHRMMESNYNLASLGTDLNVDPTHPFDIGSGDELTNSSLNNGPGHIDAEIMMFNYAIGQNM